MNKKLIAIFMIGIFVTTVSLSSVTANTIKKENSSSQISINGITDGDEITLPFTVTVDASENIDKVIYSIDYRGRGYSGWEVKEKPSFGFTINKFTIFWKFEQKREQIIESGETITIKALGYEYEETPNDSGYTLIAESDEISVDIKSSLAKQLYNNIFFEKIQQLFIRFLY